MSIKTKLINNQIIKLIIPFLPITLFSLPVLAKEPVSNNNKTLEAISSQPQKSNTIPHHLQTQINFNEVRGNLPQNGDRKFPWESVISPGEKRLMTQELEGLIGRFETTLLTAEAHHSNINISTVEIIQEILGRSTITRKENNKQIAKSQYGDAHLALHRARQGLKRFHSLIDQRYYAMATAEWSAAKQALWDNYPMDRPVAQSEVRAMWLDRGTIVKAKSKADLVPIFDSMATAGINTIFFETVNSGYTIYPSQVAPQQNPLVKGWDPLQAAIELARDRGIELHAWVWTFAAVNQRHNIILNLPRNYPGPILAKHPDWAITDQEGSRFHYSSGKIFLDPANPEVQNYLSSLLTEIATNYQVDGIHLDYIRYPFQSPTGNMTYGYGIAARDQFRKQTGFDPINLYPEHYLWSEWTKFRIEQIDNFVALAADNLHQLRPDLTLSTAVFPMPKRERLSKIQQHWETWVKQEWIDMLVPMTYAKNADTLYDLANPLLNEFDSGKALLLPGIRLLDIPDITALDQVQLLRGMSTEGYALFAAENLTPNLTNMFNTTQGGITAESKQPLPHREPFQVSLVRYQSLQKEWNFFLTNNRQKLTDAALEEWGIKADRLAQDLQKLADKPSHKNFFSTQITLNSLRRQFPHWMKETKSVDVYQATVWQNRLDTLDRLLSYGEKKVLNSDKKTVVR
ncbi:family 10 glycosylhydrolase [Waterburya agarophytonicola K14]|uniref:Family 10 glycosylhydrolase n=1 Tax=Waterburya agarophytonicola KI4 TaxID=2874699 RepID=A0A964BR23_9CYAN|nr:family 10 glycosylhydrolase [Waterburya agarophytonicola]MCC0176255.1 family 10 glycosylhydrolase [Waterburya agarophytonicola KI4]